MRDGVTRRSNVRSSTLLIWPPLYWKREENIKDSDHIKYQDRSPRKRDPEKSDLSRIAQKAKDRVETRIQVPVSQFRAQNTPAQLKVRKGQETWSQRTQTSYLLRAWFQVRINFWAPTSSSNSGNDRSPTELWVETGKWNLWTNTLDMTSLKKVLFHYKPKTSYYRKIERVEKMF